jgi:large subunit ribosomal protein L18
MLAQKTNRRNRIKTSIRKKIRGTAERPRLSVFRSNKFIYAQVVNDDLGITLAAASGKDNDVAGQKTSKTEQSKLVGKAVAQKALDAGITEVVFDRGGYLYHGRVKSLAEGAREGGLKF